MLRTMGWFPVMVGVLLSALRVVTTIFKASKRRAHNLLSQTTLKLTGEHNDSSRSCIKLE